MIGSIVSNMGVDNGFTANASVGDKTVNIPDYNKALDATMIAALNLVSAGLGNELSSALDTVAALRKKVQALETALASNNLPVV